MIKVNKSLARKMYRNGLTIHIIPCKANLKSMWFSPLPINITDVTLGSFDARVGEYTYYNCNKELGNYLHYYVSKEDYEKYNMCELMCN